MRTARGTKSAATATTLLQSACDRLPVGFALFDADFRLVASNARFAALRGYPRKLVKAGTPLESFVRFDAERGGYGAGAVDTLARTKLAALKRGRPAEREHALPDGRCLRMACERLPEGGLLLTCDDVTDARSAAQRLRESEERYDSAMRAINEGVYDWDLANSTIYYSDRVRAILRVSPKELRSPAAFLDRVHPDDRARFRAATVAHFKGETERFECDYRFRARDGSWRWARQHGVALRDARGRAYRMVGSTGDITELKERERQLAEQTAEQTVVREFLEAISRSAFDLDAVLRTLIESATRLCQAEKGFIFRLEGDVYRLAVDHGGVTPEFREFEARHLMRPGRESLVGRAALTKQVVHLEDVLADREYRLPEAQRIGGFRTMLGVPIVRDGTVIGVIALWKERVEPFTPAQIALVTAFSNQASIAIENARLFAETREALERQTATAEILKVISSSPTDVQPVFDAIARSGVQLFRGVSVSLRLVKGDRLERVAFAVGRGAQVVEDFLNLPLPFNDRTFAGRAVLRREVVHAPDVFAEDWTAEESRKLAGREGWRACAAAPMLRERHALGAIVVSRASPTPFGEKEIALLQTFADQAVIAIENVRLFNETKEALEHQTATAEILKVISSSPTDVQPVFDAIVQSGVRLFQGLSVSLRLVKGDRIDRVAFAAGSGSGVSEDDTNVPVPLDDRTVAGRAVLRREVIHVPDVSTADWIGEASRSVAERMRYRAIVAAPLVREGRALGVIGVTRARPAPFDAKEIALLQTFADQAVIAIENVRLFQELQARNRELTEALEQQTATSEILRVIARSPTDLQPVLDAVADNAIRVCEAEDALIFVPDGPTLRIVSHRGSIPRPSGVEAFPIRPGLVIARAVLDRRTIHIGDILAESEADYSDSVAYAREVGFRTMLATPLLREGAALGAVLIRRMEVRPFSDRQIRLLETFADQAVIAIENVRLFNETKEALEQQTATSEILRAIAGSPTDLQPVLDTVVRNAARLCEASNASLFRVEGDSMRLVARDGVPTTLAIGETRPIARGSMSGRAILDRQTVNVPDFLATDLATEFPDIRDAVESRGLRSCLAAPLVLEGVPIGALTVYRTEVRPFSDKQLELVKIFADQAVIAIQNVRLFNETKEALERQTATAEILKVISGSPTDTQPVFDAILEQATTLCRAEMGVLLRFDGGAYHALAMRIPDPAFAAMWAAPRRPGPASNTGLSRLAREKRPVHVPDLRDDDAYRDREPSRVEAVEVGGMRSFVGVPMLKDGELAGAIIVYRKEVRPFDERQIALLQTFADQAVIAVENVRLFNETREALDYQKASAEVLQVISSSVADTEPVFEKILESCERLFAGRNVGVELAGEDGAVHLAAYHGPIDFKQHFPVPLTEESGGGAAILQRRVMHYPDVEAPGVPHYMARGSRLAGIRSVLFAPMLWEGRGIGAIFVGREVVGDFSEKEIALLKTFADQAVIAIQNARLFNETKEALDHQKASAEVLQVISSSVADTQPVFEKILESCERLFDGLNAGVMLLGEDGQIHLRAYHGPGREELERVGPVPLSEASAAGMAILRRSVVHFPDTEAAEMPEYGRRGAKLLGYKSLLQAPMVWEGKGIGAIFVGRRDVGAFSEKEIALLKTFADQAVIAIENVRLFNELDARNRDLTESLEQQTATAEILRVISSSPTDIQPVLDAVASTASRLCEASDALIFQVDGNVLRQTASHGLMPAMLADETMPVDRGSVTGRCVVDRQSIHILDLATADEAEFPVGRAYQRRWGHHTALSTPLLREGKAIGAIGIRRLEVRPFSDQQVKLLEIFAHQAVIAIENVRLFNETKEALDQLKASAEVLQVISSSVADTRPVFETILNSCERLFQGLYVGINVVGDDGLVHLGAFHGPNREAFAALFPTTVSPESGTGVAILERRVAHYPDALSDADVPGFVRRACEVNGARAVMVAPMLWEERGIGAIYVGRNFVGPFSEKEIALLKTFADQAVIAIQNAQLFNETKEALERQTATAEILKVISSSPTDVQPVFDAIAESGVRLFQGVAVSLRLVRGDRIERVAFAAAPGCEVSEDATNAALPLGDRSFAGRAVLRRELVHVPDIPAADWVGETSRTANQRMGARAIAVAPMLRDNKVLGVIAVTRAKAGPFSDRELALLTTFADQAVIAIQNARLFNETNEALERQTATAEILKVISASPTDVQPVFDAIVKHAGRLAAGCSVNVSRLVGDRLDLAAYTSISPEADETLKSAFPVGLDEVVPIAEAIRSRSPILVSDFETDPRTGPKSRAVMRARGFRSTVYVPIVRGNAVYGVMHVSKVEPGPFPDHWVNMLRIFADQAVIAIENVRLFNETKEALDQQKASAEVLQVISSSVADTKPVFEKILESCERLFEGRFAGIGLVGHDGTVHLGAYHGPGREALEKHFPVPLSEESGSGVAILQRRIVHYPDVEGGADVPEYMQRGARISGYKSVILAPMLWEGRGIGVIFVGRDVVGEFSEKEVALLKTFADQAVIAIQNARLFNETKEALERQTATAEILRVISGSPTDVQPVFDAIGRAAVTLCEGRLSTVLRLDGEFLDLAAHYNLPAEGLEAYRRVYPRRVDRGTVAGCAVLDRTVINVADSQDETTVPPHSRAMAAAAGFRGILAVPMLREGEPIGILNVGRAEPGQFSQAHVDLLKTFADQAVIAIENVRLFNETKEALDQLKAAAEVLQVISSSVADTQPVFDKILESCERLFVGQHVGINLIGEDGDVHLGPYRGARRPELERIFPLRLSHESASGAAILERRVMHYPDTEAGAGVPEPVRSAARLVGFKSAVFAPMLWEGHAIGTIWVNREFAGSFSDKEISLLKTFADQAVIAIQNAKLFHEIQEKSHQLEIANQHKSAFLANMSHELRTPLNAVIGFSEMLSARYFGGLTDKQAEYVGDIHASGKHLLSLINDILDLSKIEAGRMELEEGEFDLRAALDNALTLVRERAQRSGVALRLETDPALGAFRGDERKLKQVVLNLLSNAVKFTPRGGAVGVVARRANGGAEIAVSDTGVGIAPRDQEAIFEAFRQVGTDVTRKREGTGLGLALSRRFVELHGGTIRVESEPGKGSTFTVTLPLPHGE